jgi:putative transposase
VSDSQTKKITVAEAAELEGIAPRNIRKKIEAGQLEAVYEKSESGGGSGGKQWLISVSSLSVPARMEWQRRQDTALRMESYRAEIAATVTDTEEPSLFEGSPKRTGALMDDGTLNPAAYRDIVGQEVYEAEMDKARRKQEIVKKALAIKAARDHVTERLTALAEANAMNVATLYRWIKEDQKSGVFGLLRKRPTVVNGKSFRAITAEIEAMIRKYYQAPGEPKAAAVYRKVGILCRELELDVPSRATVFRFIEYLEETEPDVCCFARRGQGAWAEHFAPHAVRAEPARVMQIVMGDHHKFDVFVEYGGKPIRPWVTMWLDVKSRCPVGWTVSAQANGETIGLAMTHMMTPKKFGEQTLEVGGVPEILYIDNGEDYKSALKKGLKSKDFQLSRESLDIAQYLGIKVVFATPYRPQSKANVERFFGTVAGQFSREQPGWCGAKPDERPDGYDEHKLLKQGKLLALVEFAERFNQWIETEYLSTIHGSLGVTPLEKHLDGPKANQGWPNPRTLDILRCLKEQAHVYKQGIQRFGRWYWHRELDALAGQDVVIRYDPAHIGEMHIFTSRGGYICTAENKQLLGWDVSRDDIKQLNHQRKERKKAIRERLLQTDAGLEEIVAKRKTAGMKTVSGPVGRSEGLLPAITGLDQAGRQVEKAKKKRMATKVAAIEPDQNEPLNPIDDFILNRSWA